MTDQSLQFPRFYVTAPSTCPYLPEREERKVFTELKGDEAGPLNEALSRVGFRRSQSVAYRPACEACSACISVRVVARDFAPSRSMRRVIRANDDVQVRIVEPWISEEQYRLLKRYLSARHAEGGMADMDIYEYAEMVENSPVDTVLIEYRVPDDKETSGLGRLIAVALSDRLGDGLSMVYSFFDPEEKSRSLGRFMILDHIRQVKREAKRNVYLGYWIAESPKMAYKAQFAPMERLGAEGWFPMQETAPSAS